MTISSCPYTTELRESVMTNFDHSIHVHVAEALKNEPAFSRYPGWNFNGRVWWARDVALWRCEVWCYCSPVAVVDATTLEELMEKVCDRWGEE